MIPEDPGLPSGNLGDPRSTGAGDDPGRAGDRGDAEDAEDVAPTIRGAGNEIEPTRRWIDNRFRRSCSLRGSRGEGIASFGDSLAYSVAIRSGVLSSAISEMVLKVVTTLG